MGAVHNCPRYRARFITGTVAALAGKEGGGEAWLMGLRLNKSYEEARDALASLPGGWAGVVMVVVV